MRAASSRSRFRQTGTTFENILVCGIPLHDAPILLRQAASVVTPGESTIRLLEPSSASPFIRAGAEPLDRVIHSLIRMGVPLLRERTGGTSGEEIVEQIVGGRHDLVIKGVAAGHEERRTLVPLDLALVRRSPCPVWFVECMQVRTPRRIVAAIDPEADDDRSRPYARRVAALAQGLADALGAELHVLHAWIAFGESLLRNRMSASELETYVAAARQGAERGSESILADRRLPLPASHIHFRKGELGDVLPRFAVEGDFDLIVMGTRGRKGWLDSVVRPHAESILSSTSASVLVARHT